MAQPVYRSFIGVAKDTTNAWLQTSVIATGATLTLRNITQAGTALTVTGATYSVVIVDGVNTEIKACTGNATGTTDGSTIAVTALSNAHSANAYCYFQLTASIGPTAYIPVRKLAWADDIPQLYDENYRGSNVKHFGAQQGMRKGALTLDADIFADTFGYLLSPFFGAYDYTATSGGNPTTYAFSPLNTGTGQPTPYLFYDYNPGAQNTRVICRALVSDLTIKADPGALLNYTATIMGFSSGVVANPGTIPPAYSAVTTIPSRVATATIGGTSTYKTMAYEMNLKREEFGAINTLQGIQDPIAIFAGPATAVGKLTLVVDDDVQFNNYINASQPAVLFTATQGATTAANGITIQNTKANYEASKILQDGHAWVTLEQPFTALANATDASTAGAGLSPVKFTLSTGTTTGATLY